MTNTYFDIWGQIDLEIKDHVLKKLRNWSKIITEELLWMCLSYLNITFWYLRSNSVKFWGQVRTDGRSDGWTENTSHRGALLLKNLSPRIYVYIYKASKNHFWSWISQRWFNQINYPFWHVNQYCHNSIRTNMMPGTWITKISQC